MVGMSDSKRYRYRATIRYKADTNKRCEFLKVFEMFFAGE